jgi:hypothetical protein
MDNQPKLGHLRVTNFFEQPDYKGQQALLDAINRNDTMLLPSMIIATVLYDDDFEFARTACIRLCEHEGEIIRGNAILGFGHLARLFGKLGEQEIAIIKRGLHDPSDYVRGQAHAAADDLKQFLEVDVRAP